MNAHDLMSRDVVTVTPETPVRDVARVLLQHGISAVPVVDGAGMLVGMVSEGDLLGRRRSERESRSEEWLTRLAEGEALNHEFLAHLEHPLAVARDVMSSPVLSISEDTRADQIASLMGVHRVKRLPVLRDGRIVGIVRRADLLRSVGGGKFEPVPIPHRHHPEPAPPPAPSPPAAVAARPEPGPAPSALPIDTRPESELTVADFRHLVEAFSAERDRDRVRRRERAAIERRATVKRLLESHVTDADWAQLLRGARAAAERGEKEFLLLRFPNLLCSDAGRAVNVPDPGWPRTLRGEAAEIYLRWEEELRPRGFRLTARVLDFPGGMPGDIGLFLNWAA